MKEQVDDESDKKSFETRAVMKKYDKRRRLRRRPYTVAKLHQLH